MNPAFERRVQRRKPRELIFLITPDVSVPSRWIDSYKKEPKPFGFVRKELKQNTLVDEELC